MSEQTVLVSGFERAFNISQHTPKLATASEILESAKFNPQLLRKYLRLATISMNSNKRSLQTPLPSLYELTDEVTGPSYSHPLRQNLSVSSGSRLWILRLLAEQERVSSDFARSFYVLNLAWRIYADMPDH